MKRPLYVFCSYPHCTNYTKCIQILIESYSYAAADIYFLYIQKRYILYFWDFRINNDAIVHSIWQPL